MKFLSWKQAQLRRGQSLLQKDKKGEKRKAKNVQNEKPKDAQKTKTP